MKEFGLIGKNINYSFSPVLHKKISDFYNLSSNYTIFDIPSTENFYNFLEEIKTSNKNSILGLNITIPYKKDILKIADFLSDEVKEIKAANCIKVNKNRIEAYNTDYFGVLKTFEKMKLDLTGKEVYILGTGGAALAVAKALKDIDASPFFVTRDKKNNSFKNLLDYVELREKKGILLINATPIGTYPNIDFSPVSKEIIKNFDALLDLIYNPRETLFLKLGKELKKQTENGLYMLVVQAVKSQEIWNDLSLNYASIFYDIKIQLQKGEK